MNSKLYFEDGSSLVISIEEPETGTMAMKLYKKLSRYVEEELVDDPNITLLNQTQLAAADDELDDLSLDEEDLDELDEEWVDEDEDELDEDWSDDDEEDDDWV